MYTYFYPTLVCIFSPVLQQILCSVSFEHMEEITYEIGQSMKIKNKTKLLSF